MGMTKTGNTYAPGDKVQKHVERGDKVASHRGGGSVMDADPDMGTVRVQWPDGDVTIEDANKLERA